MKEPNTIYQNDNLMSEFRTSNSLGTEKIFLAFQFSFNIVNKKVCIITLQQGKYSYWFQMSNSYLIRSARLSSSLLILHQWKKNELGSVIWTMNISSWPSAGHDIFKNCSPYLTEPSGTSFSVVASKSEI